MEYIQIGKLGKPHGLEGSVKVLLWDEYVDFVPQTVLFVEQNGDIIPFFIETCKNNGTHLLVRFEDFDNPNAAYQVAQKKLYLRPQDLPKEFKEEEVSEFQGLIGLRLKDETLGEIGSIIDFDEEGPQLMVLVENKESTFVIPWVEAYILDSNEDFVLVNLPEGLVQ